MIKDFTTMESGELIVTGNLRCNETSTVGSVVVTVTKGIPVSGTTEIGGESSMLMISIGNVHMKLGMSSINSRIDDVDMAFGVSLKLFNASQWKISH